MFQDKAVVQNQTKVRPASMNTKTSPNIAVTAVPVDLLCCAMQSVRGQQDATLTPAPELTYTDTCI
jgi:hypothetical protein